VHFFYTSTIGTYRGAEIETKQTTIVSTRHTTNNDRIPEDEIAMFQALQKQMEEIRQKSIKDRQKNEEEVRILIEQNEELR